MREPIHFIRDTKTWVDIYHQTGDALILDRRTLKNKLKESGADFSTLTHEDHLSLKKFQNSESAKAVTKVWGFEFYNSYKSFCLHWAENFESNKENRPLPKLKNINKDRGKKASESKLSGMLHVLHFFTSYAAGDLTTKKFSEYLNKMDVNGQLWQQKGFDDARAKVEVDGKMIKMGSIPDGFAKDAWEFMQTWKK